MTFKKYSDSETQDSYSDKKLSMIAEKWKGWKDTIFSQLLTWSKGIEIRVKLNMAVFVYYCVLYSYSNIPDSRDTTNLEIMVK